MVAPGPKRLYLWFDTEFTDLNPERAALLQVALLATNERLEPAGDPRDALNLPVRLAPEAPVSPWVEKNIPDILARARAEDALPVAEIDRRLCAYIDGLAGPPAPDIEQRPVLAGNSVHADYALARIHLPRFFKRIHYRLLDASTLKLLWEDRGGPEFDKENKDRVRSFLPWNEPLDGAPHDAWYDILASIAELNYYRRTLLKNPA